MKLTRILRFHQKQLCHSEMRIDLMDLWIAHIYISAIPNPRNPLTESSKITKEIMNTDYRYQFPDNPSLSVNNMPLLRDKDGLIKERGFLFLAG